MKKPFKGAFIAFTVLAFFMLAGFVACYVVYPMLILGVDFMAFVKGIFLNPSYYKNTILSFHPIYESISWILGAVFIVVYLALFIVALVGGIRGRKAAVIVFGIFISLFGLVVAAAGVTALWHNFIEVYAVSDQFERYIGILAHFSKGGMRNLVGGFILIGEVLTTVLYVVFSILAVVMGVKYALASRVNDEEVPAEAVEEPAEEEPQPEPEPEAVQEDLPVFIPEPEDEPIDPQSMSTTALAAIIKDVVREIVRDELERNNLLGKEQQQPSNQSVVGATFGGPLIVQYFNGGIQSVPAPAPAPAPAPKEEPKPEPKPEPVKEEPQPEPQPEPEPEPQPEPAPVVEEPAPAPAPAPVEKQPKAPIVRIPFEERLLGSEKELQDLYSELKNEILSYGVKSRVSSSGDTFRLHRKTYIKMTVAGKSLKLYFALNPDDYRDSPIPVQDAGGKSIYEEIPLVFKVKSPLSVRRCKQLIQDVMERDNLEQGEVGQVNWIKELKAEMKARKSEKK